MGRLERYETAVATLRKNLAEDTSRPTTSEVLSGLAAFEVDPKVVAQQLTHIELVIIEDKRENGRIIQERFGMVGVDEIVTAVAAGNIGELGKATVRF